MKFISIASQEAGYACATSKYISKYFYNNQKPREFFDLITISMKSVNEVLLSKPIEFNDKEYDFYRVPNSTNNIIIGFKNFDSMTSFHDLIDTSINSINSWKNIYSNLQNKMIHNIKNSNEPIIFFRTVKNKNDIQEDGIHTFFNTIYSLNPNLKFYFIMLTDKKIDISKSLLEKKGFILFNFSDYIDPNKKYDENIYNRIINDYEYLAIKKIIDNFI